MKLGELFEKEWECQNSMCDPCYSSDNSRDPLHAHCGWRYVSSLNEWEYERLKDIKIL